MRPKPFSLMLRIAHGIAPVVVYPSVEDMVREEDGP